MKTMIRFLSLTALALAFALPAFAQDPAATPAQGPCTEQARTDMYTDYYNSKSKKDAKGQPDVAAQKHAFEIGQQYLAKYEAACPDQYTTAVKKFVVAYGIATHDYELAKAWEAKDYPKVVSLSKEALTNNPDDVKAAINGAWGAYQGVAVAKNTSLTGDASSLAQRALQLLQAGKTADSYYFSSRDEAQGWMEYVVGALSVKDNPADAVKHLITIAQGNGPAKQEPSTYYYLARAYEDEYQKLNEKYKTFTTETDESRIVLANINQTIDRIIDAYARAVAYSTKPEQQKDKATYMATLTELYKSRHDGADTGLNEMIASITTKPLLITTPVTTAPAPSIPAGTGDGNGGAKPPVVTTPPAATPTPTTTRPAQPAPSPTPTPGKKPPVHRG
jgi:hypothetical protein